ncbi:hypothetical protein [Pseudomonas sp. dw_612]|uniref:hypothetical protein n=1 Tax=Pseudomonas sp. dw_612 TaxID=2720080 RepID=UPI001BD3C13B|nr:hypothetical protein [Pseudomonas sp. dw_612]
MWLIELLELKKPLANSIQAVLNNRFYALMPKNNRFYAEKIDFERYSPFVRLFNLAELFKGV